MTKEDDTQPYWTQFEFLWSWRLAVLLGAAAGAAASVFVPQVLLVVVALIAAAYCGWKLFQ